MLKVDSRGVPDASQQPSDATFKPASTVNEAIRLCVVNECENAVEAKVMSVDGRGTPRP